MSLKSTKEIVLDEIDIKSEPEDITLGNTSQSSVLMDIEKHEESPFGESCSVRNPVSPNITRKRRSQLLLHSNAKMYDRITPDIMSGNRMSGEQSTASSPGMIYDKRINTVTNYDKYEQYKYKHIKKAYKYKYSESAFNDFNYNQNIPTTNLIGKHMSHPISNFINDELPMDLKVVSVGKKSDNDEKVVASTDSSDNSEVEYKSAEDEDYSSPLNLVKDCDKIRDGESPLNLKNQKVRSDRESRGDDGCNVKMIDLSTSSANFATSFTAKIANSVTCSSAEEKVALCHERAGESGMNETLNVCPKIDNGGDKEDMKFGLNENNPGRNGLGNYEKIDEFKDKTGGNNIIETTNDLKEETESLGDCKNEKDNCGNQSQNDVNDMSGQSEDDMVTVCDEVIKENEHDEDIEDLKKDNDSHEKEQDGEDENGDNEFQECKGTVAELKDDIGNEENQTCGVVASGIQMEDKIEDEIKEEMENIEDLKCENEDEIHQDAAMIEDGGIEEKDGNNEGFNCENVDLRQEIEDVKGENDSQDVKNEEDEIQEQIEDVKNENVDEMEEKEDINDENESEVHREKDTVEDIVKVEDSAGSVEDINGESGINDNEDSKKVEENMIDKEKDGASLEEDKHDESQEVQEENDEVSDDRGEMSESNLDAVEENDVEKNEENSCEYGDQIDQTCASCKTPPSTCDPIEQERTGDECEELESLIQSNPRDDTPKSMDDDRLEMTDEQTVDQMCPGTAVDNEVSQREQIESCEEDAEKISDDVSNESEVTCSKNDVELKNQSVEEIDCIELDNSICRSDGNINLSDDLEGIANEKQRDSPEGKRQSKDIGVVESKKKLSKEGIESVRRDKEITLVDLTEKEGNSKGLKRTSEEFTGHIKKVKTDNVSPSSSSDEEDDSSSSSGKGASSSSSSSSSVSRSGPCKSTSTDEDDRLNVRRVRPNEYKSKNISNRKTRRELMERERLRRRKSQRRKFLKQKQARDRHSNVRVSETGGNSMIKLESGSNYVDDDIIYVGNDETIREPTGTSMKLLKTENDEDDPRPLKCELCRYSCKLPGTLRKHMAKDHPETCRNYFLYACNICNYVNTLKDDIRKHIENKHGGKGNFTCAVSRPDSYNFDYDYFQVEIPYPCRFCNYVTCMGGDMTNHMYYRHRELIETFGDFRREGVKRTSGKSTVSSDRHSSSLTERLAVSTSYYMCQCCDFKTRNPDRFDSHVSTSHAKRTYRCSYCSYTTLRKCEMNKHKAAIHETDSLHVCNLCSFRTTRKSHLSRHILLNHTQDYVFSCRYCSYKTTSTKSFSHHVEMEHT